MAAKRLPLAIPEIGINLEAHKREASMRRLALALSFGVCAVSARAGAQPRAHASATQAKVAPQTGPRPLDDDAVYGELVAAADSDGNAHVSLSELASLVRRYVAKQVQARFHRLDRNGDGRVTRAEVPNMPAERFARFDADRDGAFTPVELERVAQEQAAARCRAVFARLDVDRDGALSASDAENGKPTRVSSR